ncbi:MAG: SET domain-containing protein [Ignavibacteria bacterium]|nr:SET domain-containing protein [Ignavibacteria bacterium]
MHSPTFVKLQLKESFIHDLGCYAVENIPQGAFVIEYTGELISAEEALKREADKTRNGIYTFWISEEFAIDGYEQGNYSRYFNHSCLPNCEYEIKEKTILFYASRDILQGEELTIDYAFDAEGEKVQCCCGKENCRGVINALET